MAVINPYLNFNGNTEQVFNFYKSVFGGEFASLMRFKDVPENAGQADKDKELIMHVALPIGTSILMGTDVPDTMPQVEPGSSMSICISVDSREQADEWFKGLAQGGKITMPLQDMFWGDYYGMVTDKFKIQWMISYNPNQNKL